MLPSNWPKMVRSSLPVTSPFTTRERPHWVRPGSEGVFAVFLDASAMGFSSKVLDGGGAKGFAGGTGAGTFRSEFKGFFSHNMNLVVLLAFYPPHAPLPGNCRPVIVLQRALGRVARES